MVLRGFLFGICLLSVQAFADVELRFLNKGKEGIVEYGTAYLTDRPKGVDPAQVQPPPIVGPGGKAAPPRLTLELGWCGETGEACDRDSAKRILKSVPYPNYLDRLVKQQRIRPVYLSKDGPRVLQRAFEVAKKANNRDYLNTLNQSKANLETVNSFLPFLQKGQDSELVQGAKGFDVLIRPLEAEPLFRGKEGRHVELLGGVEWIHVKEKSKAGYLEAKAACTEEGASLPSTLDIQRVSNWAAQSPLARWGIPFWMAGATSSRRGDTRREPRGGGTLVRDISFETLRLNIAGVFDDGEVRQVELHDDIREMATPNAEMAPIEQLLALSTRRYNTICVRPFRFE